MVCSDIFNQLGFRELDVTEVLLIALRIDALPQYVKLAHDLHWVDLVGVGERGERKLSVGSVVGAQAVGTKGKEGGGVRPVAV